MPEQTQFGFYGDFQLDNVEAFQELLLQVI